MTNLTQKAVAAIVAVVGITAASQSAEAASFKPINRSAVQLARQAKQLSGEFRAHYAHTPSYRRLMSDTAEIRRLANHLHEAAHRGRASHMSNDLRKLNRSFHHLKGLVKKLEHNATHDPYGYDGQIEGNTSDVRRMMRRMEKSLHHLQKEINEMLHPPAHNNGDIGFGGGYNTPRYRSPRYRSPRYRSPRHGFSYRNGDFAIRFGH